MGEGLASLFEGGSKAEHIYETLRRVFGQRLQHNSIYRSRQVWDALVQGSWVAIEVLAGEVINRALKGKLATEPFIDHDCQGILVARRRRLPPDLLGSHVG